MRFELLEGQREDGSFAFRDHYDGSMVIWNESMMQRPKRFNDTQLLNAGVLIVDRSRMEFKCFLCGRPYLVMAGGLKRMPRNYWRCETGCNKHL